MDFVEQGHHWNCYFNGTLKRYVFFFLSFLLFLFQFLCSLFGFWEIRSYILRCPFRISFFLCPVTKKIFRDSSFLFYDSMNLFSKITGVSFINWGQFCSNYCYPSLILLVLFLFYHIVVNYYQVFFSAKQTRIIF